MEKFLMGGRGMAEHAKATARVDTTAPILASLPLIKCRGFDWG